MGKNITYFQFTYRGVKFLFLYLNLFLGIRLHPTAKFQVIDPLPVLRLDVSIM